MSDHEQRSISARHRLRSNNLRGAGSDPSSTARHTDRVVGIVTCYPCEDCLRLKDGGVFCTMNCSSVAHENKVYGW